MLHLYMNRDLKIGEKVKVYYNLHTHLFSIVSLEGEYKGKVVAHGNGIWLEDAKFTVNRKGQFKVRVTRVKGVHAFIVGIFKGTIDLTLKRYAYYNPFITDYFIDYTTRETLRDASQVILRDKRITYCL